MPAIKWEATLYQADETNHPYAWTWVLWRGWTVCTHGVVSGLPAARQALAAAAAEWDMMSLDVSVLMGDSSFEETWYFPDGPGTHQAWAKDPPWKA